MVLLKDFFKILYKDIYKDIYKTYTQSHIGNIGNIGIISLICLGYIFLAPSIGCPIDWDCNNYINMVDSLVYNSAMAPHHAMRILPALLVKFFVLLFGLSIENSFKLLSGLSYLSFSLGFYFVLNKILEPSQKSESKLFILSLSLLTMASHHAVIQALVNVYQSTDALTYPIVLFMFYFTYYKKQYHWVFVLTLLGLITRQNLFFMGELCLLFGLITQKKLRNIFYIILAGAAYKLLVSYYHAEEMLLSTITPEAGFFTLENILYIIQDSGIFNLIIPIIPIAIFTVKELVLFYFKNWYLLLYAAITVGQPFLAYHLTGNNFERIAMQGVWPLYLITGIIFYENHINNNDKNKNLILFILFFYSAALLLIMKFPPSTAEPLRLILSVFLGLFISLLLLIKRLYSSNNTSVVN